MTDPKTGAVELPQGMTLYYVVLLVRGPTWTPEARPELEKLQEQHLAHLARLAGTGKLIMAGPFLDGGFRRGLTIYKTDSLEEARTLAEADPAVQVGRLAVEIHPWMTREGVLP